MFGKLRAVHWVAILAVLGIIWWLSGRVSPAAQQRTFREEIMRVDTAKVNAITIVPAAKRRYPELHFMRRTEGWSLHMGLDSAYVDEAPVNTLLAAIHAMRPVQLAGTLSMVKERYDLGDSARDRLLIEAGPQRYELFVGRSTSGDEPFTVVNPPGDENAYAIAGKLGELTDRTFGGWLPKYLVMGDPMRWNRLIYTFPGDSGYVLKRYGDRWLIDGHPTDSTRIWKYLYSLARSKGRSVADPRDTLMARPAFRLVVEDSTEAQPTIVVVFALPDRFIVRSSLNPGTVMPFDAREEVPRMFRRPRAFM